MTFPHPTLQGGERGFRSCNLCASRFAQAAPARAGAALASRGYRARLRLLWSPDSHPAGFRLSRRLKWLRLHQLDTAAWDRQRERRGSKASVAAVAPCGLKVRAWARIARAYVTSRTHTRDPQLDPAHKGPCSEEAIHTHDRIDERQVEKGTLAAARRGLSFFLFRVCVRATLGFGL